jgi:adenylate kinase family enzyme
MKKITFIFGTSGSGKSTFGSKLKEGYNNLAYVDLGKKCRERWKLHEMAARGDAFVPGKTERYVRNLIKSVFDNDNANYGIIVGAPRTLEQLQFIVNQSYAHRVTISFVCIHADKDIRKRMMNVRDGDESEVDDFNEKRMGGECEYILDVLSVLCNCNFQLLVVNNRFEDNDIQSKRIAEFVFKAREWGKSTSISTMMVLNNRFSDMSLSETGVTSTDLYNDAFQIDEAKPMHKSVEWTRRFVRRAMEELNELLEKLPEEWWAKKDKADLRGARVELIDAFHFILSAANSLGMDGYKFSKTYHEKRDINVERQKSGYSKKNKNGVRDDDHIGKCKETE